MIIGKSKKEIEQMRAAGQLAGLVLSELRNMVKPGISTIEIDRAAEQMIRDAGALLRSGLSRLPLFHLCFSYRTGVHGFPSDYE